MYFHIGQGELLEFKKHELDTVGKELREGIAFFHGEISYKWAAEKGLTFGELRLPHF